MEEPRFGHVGIAVDDLEAARDGLATALGLSFEPIEEVEAQQVRVAFAPSAGLELVEATSPNSPRFPMLQHPISSFLGKHGQGLHHLCLRVSDLGRTIDHLRASGVRTLTEEPQRGAHGAPVVFLHPEDCQGLLIELCEEHDDPDRRSP